VRPRRLLALSVGLAVIAPIAALSVAGTATAAPAAAAPAAAEAALAPTPDRMPGDVPSKKTPWIMDGQVYKIVQVGNTMIAGGEFTTVADPMNGPQYARQNLVAFDATTGLVSQTFNPTVDGSVEQLMPGPTPNTVYVAGAFTKINGKGPNHIQLLNINTGQAVTSFKAPSTGGTIQVMELLPNNRLFIGGSFKKIAGNDHGQFATLNATTGALDPYMNLVAAGNHNTGTGAKAPVGPRESGLTPSGDRMVVVGNFRTVDGLARDQIVMLDLTGPTARVVTDWYTTRYTPICAPRAFDSYMRDVEMSPDGSYFVVSTTGGPNSGTLCDNAARWETYATGTALQPTWAAASGGDTLWGVEVTESAVYVGGHQRWMNNPNGSDRAAQGAVPRPGLVALDPQTGVPLKWNPGRNPRGEAAYEIFETQAGVWVVSNTVWIGDRRYQRQRVAFFPYDEGYNVASKTTGSLPGNVYLAAPDSAATTVLHRVNAGGSSVTATDGGPNWSADTSTSSSFRNTGSSTSSYTGTVSLDSSVPAGTPTTLFNSERYDPAGGNEMMWTFPVTAGTPTQVRLYFANRCTCTQSPGQRVFDVRLDGQTVLDDFDMVAAAGATNRGVMRSFDITSDGTVNIDFIHGVENPQINAIEILKRGTPNNNSSASVIGFDGTAVGSQATSATANFDWTNVRGATMVGRTLFYGQTDNMLYRRSFDGERFGEPSVVNPYIDPAWNTVETGSGPAGQTYAGVLPTWYSQLSGLTGMFYTDGRLYYTRSGQNTLYWRYFSPDSGIVNPTENTVTGGNISWSSTKGMFLDGNTLYVVNNSNGQLLKIGWNGTAPTGSSSVANATIDWRGRALFLASVLPNVGPVADFDADCLGAVCTFDGTLSTDVDGSIVSYEWEFSDGEQAGGPHPEKEFAVSGVYDATLTVTDDGGLTSTITKQVSVERPNVAPTAEFGSDCDYLECEFDATGSTDGDGTIEEYGWDFGDGETGSGDIADHVFDAPGTYDVTLTVTDDDDAAGEVTKSITVNAAPVPSTVSYRGGSVNQGNVATPNVTLPSSVAAGDRVLLVLTVNANNKVMSAPTGVTGWTVLGTTTSGSMQTRVYTKVAVASDANKKVTVPLDSAAKYTLTSAVYSGVRSGALVYADLAENVSRTEHTTPSVTAPAGSWVVSYWSDKSATTTGFDLPGAVSQRHATCGANAGHICSALADSNGSVPAGQYGGLVGTADSANATATTWSIVLRTQEANQAPTAAFTYTCDGADCDFDGRTSSDTDGNVVSYAWDFGDGGTATGATPGHDFVTSGTRNVTLTVTDDEGTQGSVVIPVAVVRSNAAPTASFTTSCDYLVCTFDATASDDTDGDIVSYAWDFGDGDTGTGPNPSHEFDAAGGYVVRLTVVDNDNAEGTTTRNVSPVAVRPIVHVNTTTNQGNVATPNTTIPAGTQAGDRLVLILSLNANNRVESAATGVTGWNLLDRETSGSMSTSVYTKVAVAADAGKTVRIPLDAAAKYTMTAATYRGDMVGAPQVEVAAENVSRAAHTTPTIAAGAGDWALSYWADKSAATTAFTLPNSVTSRGEICGNAAGHMCSALADSAGGVDAGPYGGLTATADSAQATATMWTILLRQDS